MSLPFLRIPFLAQIEIFKFMDLFDAFSLSTLSKRSREVVKRGVRYQEVKLDFERGRLMISRAQETADKNHFSLYFDFEDGKYAEQQLWSLYDWRGVCVRIQRTPLLNLIFRYWPRELQHELLKYFVELFPKHSVHLSIDSNNKTTNYRDTIEYVKTLGKNLNFETLTVTNYDDENEDNLVKSVIMDAGGAKNLELYCKVSPHIQINFKDHKLERIYIRYGVWVSKDHLIKLLGSCKKVTTDKNFYTDKGLSVIFKAWMTGLPAELLEIDDVRDFYDKESTHKMLGALPGAVAVRRAEIFSHWRETFVVREYTQRRCFMIAQPGGIKALIYTTGFGITLTTNFKIDSLDFYD